MHARSRGIRNSKAHGTAYMGATRCMISRCSTCQPFHACQTLRATSIGPPEPASWPLPGRASAPRSLGLRPRKNRQRTQKAPLSPMFRSVGVDEGGAGGPAATDAFWGRARLEGRLPTPVQAIDKALKAAGVYKAINQEQAKKGKVDFVKVRWFSLHALVSATLDQGTPQSGRFWAKGRHLRSPTPFLSSPNLGQGLGIWDQGEPGRSPD